MDANTLRREVANSQRMKKTREKWSGFCEQLTGDCWSELTELNGVKIGEETCFVETRRNSRDHVIMSQRRGTLFAVGTKSFVVVYKGELQKISLKVG